MVRKSAMIGIPIPPADRQSRTAGGKFYRFNLVPDVSFGNPLGLSHREAARVGRGTAVRAPVIWVLLIV
jgi:hypothetical protein